METLWNWFTTCVTPLPSAACCWLLHVPPSYVTCPTSIALLNFFSGDTVSPFERLTCYCYLFRILHACSPSCPRSLKRWQKLSLRRHASAQQSMKRSYGIMPVHSKA
eukprot:1417281-Amphidinium_carterae.1